MTLPRKSLALLYLLFAIAGAILTGISNIEFVRDYGPGFDILKFVELSAINPAAESLSRDLFITSSAFITWIFIESKRLQMKNLWLIIIGTFTIAFAFSAPLFLCLRELRLIELEREGKTFEI